MAIYIGSNQLVRRYVGEQEVLRTYVGEQLVWSRGFQLEGVVAAQQVPAAFTILHEETMTATASVTVSWTVNWASCVNGSSYVVGLLKNGSQFASNSFSNLTGVQQLTATAQTTVAPGDVIAFRSNCSASSAANRQIASSPWNIYTP